MDRKKKLAAALAAVRTYIQTEEEALLTPHSPDGAAGWAATAAGGAGGVRSASSSVWI